MNRVLPSIIIQRMLMVLFWCFLAGPIAAQIGGLDSSFAPSLNGAVKAMLTQSDGKVLIVGDFTMAGGTTVNRIARFNMDGTLDSTFLAGSGANGTIRCISLDSDSSHILIGGDFTSYNGTTRNRVARLAANGALDTAFLTSGSGANGTVYGIASSYYGTVIGGAFTTVNGNNRNYIARLTSSGTTDTTFNPGANDIVYAVAADNSYNYFLPGYYVGGAFTSVGGSARNRFARITYYGSVDSSLSVGTGANGNVYAICLQSSQFSPSSSSIYLGGDFTSFNGVGRAHLAVLNTASYSYTIPDPNFNVWADSAVRCFYQASTLSSSAAPLFIGGDFSMINGVPKNRVARLLASGNSYSSSPVWYLDTTFDPGSGPDATVNAIATETDGKVFIGGQFATVSGMTQQAMARLNGDGGSTVPNAPNTFSAGGVSTSQNALVWSSVPYITNYKVEKSADGVGGWTQIAAPTSASPYFDSSLAASYTGFYRVRAVSTNGESANTPILSATTFNAPWIKAGALDSSFNFGTGASSSVYCSALQADGKIVIAGSFYTINGVTRNYIARLNADGTLDTSFDPGTGPDSTVAELALLPDGRVMIAGYFSHVAGVARQYIARLNADGSLDTSFDPGTGPGSPLSALSVTRDGKTIIVGSFSSYNGVSHPYIAQLNQNGSLDSSFNTSINSSASAVNIQRDRRILLGGYFSTVNGQSRSYLVRLNTDGTTDSTFNAGSSAFDIKQIIQQTDGKIALMGSFSTVNGVARKYVARLNSDGSLDTSFDPGIGPNNTLDSLAVQPDGKMLIGGYLTTYQSTLRLGLARLNTDGSLDDTFQPGSGTTSAVENIHVLSDGHILIGGYFSSFNGGSQKYFTRLLGDGSAAATPAAPTGLAVSVASSTQLLLSWTYSFTETGYTIERSSDGVTNWMQIADQPTPFDYTFFNDNTLTPGSTWYYRVHAYNSAGISISSNAVVATTYTSYQQWEINAGLNLNTSDSDDSDHDGVPLLMEYALGFDPKSSNSSSLPSMQTVGNYLTLSYTKLRPDLNYLVEVSTDLKTWTSDSVAQGGNGPSVIAFTPISGTKQFLRLRVSHR